MNIRSLISFLAFAILIILAQILLLKNLALFGVAFGFLYVMVILDLPISIKPIPLLLIGFGLGLFIDVFYDTTGMHAASATLLGFIRPHWLKLVSPTGGYDDNNKPNLREMGLSWYITYALPLVLAYTLVFFLVDTWGTGNLLEAFNKGFFSTIFTVALAILVQLLFFKRRRGI
ncbi:rod shape-determining protein MreD [Algoriphagus sp. CAU 1675]|uniref:rod shape-determining protein MreD n=1 Tax=Algoriphagus sp. CAU 1675 TaxID=3032597 RepID=UPI0023DA64CF|nr:rod shape-determining protein MreD [Algoriphagus sp. CAU 1675]MDF2158929.1 rod shape-determining protein MreD [Algoriphagus sp. CAU 1675]